MSPENFTITRVLETNSKDIQDSIHLVQLYAKSLDIDLTFQDFSAEKRKWPGNYSPPTGALLLARNAADGEAIGCVALRCLDHDVCEMKRLYVDPRGRGIGVGKALAEAIVSEAKRMGYRAMRLDTLPSMSAARGLYGTIGFKEIDAYYVTPIEGTVFLEKSLVED